MRGFHFFSNINVDMAQFNPLPCPVAVPCRTYFRVAIKIHTKINTIVDFGECYPRGSTGAITTCNPQDGTSTIETYLDTKCTKHLYSSKNSPKCENLKVDGDTCPAGGPASSSTDCTNMSEFFFFLVTGFVQN